MNNNENSVTETQDMPLPENALMILEAALFSSSEPLPLHKLEQLFPQVQKPNKKQLGELLEQLMNFYAQRGVELVEVASGFRFQVRADYAQPLQRLWEKKPPHYSRVLLETLALIVYRQPITRGEIEEIRGVAVSAHVMKTLIDHQWIKTIGYKNVPGKPALWGTTKQFLDYFNLKSLTELPPLQDLVDLSELEKKLTSQVELPLAETECVS